MNKPLLDVNAIPAKWVAGRSIFVVVIPERVRTGAHGIKHSLGEIQAGYLTQNAADKCLVAERACLSYDKIHCTGCVYIRPEAEVKLYVYTSEEILIAKGQ